MLRVRIDSREVEVTPVALAQMMLDGMVSRHHLTKASDGAAERPLEFALDPLHCEVLAAELLRRLRSMYASDVTSYDIDDLRGRIEALCQWHWRVPEVRARLLWVAAWLNELTGRMDAAVGYYDAFLRVRCHEVPLRLLAYNNRGVLRVRLGRGEGVADLARAAIVTEPGGGESERSAGLPAACFNLLNLINVAAPPNALSEVVDEELVDFFAQLPEDVAGWWLGSEARERPASDGTSSSENEKLESPKVRSILRDSSCLRLNKLTANLVGRAMRLTEGTTLESSEHAQQTSCRLSLWAGEAEGGDAPDRSVEAASLLLADAIPSALVTDEGPGRRVEQLAQEELAEIEDLVAGGNHELARSRLEVQRRVLAALNHRQRFSNLLAQVDAQLQRIAREKKELEQLELQRTCGNLVAEMEQFCKLTSLSEAVRRLGPLKQRLQSHRARTSDEVAGLLDELAQRLERHVVQLRRCEVRKRVHLPLGQLRESWPADWAVPVPEAAYAALAECHINDPESQVEDWPALKDQLDAHQAQYCLRKALAELPSDQVSWDQIETALADALSLAPELWLTVAPLFGLRPPHNDKNGTETKMEVCTALESAAARLWHESQSAPEHRRERLFQRAGALLGRVFRLLRGDVRRFVRLWECLEMTLATALVAAGEDVIAEVETLARTCLDHWPAGRTEVPTRADPRNPVRLFWESCEKVRALALAERLLGEQPAALKEAGKQVVRALRLGLETAEQFKRAAACIYLAEYSQDDAAPMQRQVLARLDEWVEGMVIDPKQFTGPESIVNALVVIRADVVVAPSASDAERTDATDRPEG